MFHTTKYGSGHLLGMNTKVSTVKDTQGGDNRQFKHWQIQELQHLSFHGIWPKT